MKKETVEEFLARGGKITKCPRGPILIQEAEFNKYFHDVDALDREIREKKFFDAIETVQINGKKRKG